MTMTDARARVATGAALLDRIRPDWAENIDVDRLQMNNDCFCPLGQLECSFNAAAERIWGKPFHLNAAAHGFYVAVPDAYADYSLLQQAWVEQIALRMFPSEAAPELVGVTA